MKEHPKKERTLVIIKPDGVQRSLMGEIVSRLEKVGLKIMALKMLIPVEEQVIAQYGPSKEEIEALGRRSIEKQTQAGMEVKLSPLEQGTAIVDKMKKFMKSGPVLAMILEGNQAVAVVRKVIGATEPLRSDVGTIRGDYTIDSYQIADSDGRAVRNLIHASGSIDEAEREIKIWFKPEEILKYNLISERILYDVNLDGILE